MASLSFDSRQFQYIIILYSTSNSPSEQFPIGPTQASFSHDSRQVSERLLHPTIPTVGEYLLNHRSFVTGISAQPITEENKNGDSSQVLPVSWDMQ